MAQGANPAVHDGVGERWARALARRDAPGLKALLQPDVDFRAVTPGRCWESSDTVAVVDDTILGTWFSPDSGNIELLDLEVGWVGPVERVRYQLKVRAQAGTWLVEQTAYIRCRDGRMASLRILCSGYLSAGITSTAQTEVGEASWRHE